MWIKRERVESWRRLSSTLIVLSIKAKPAIFTACSKKSWPFCFRPRPSLSGPLGTFGFWMPFHSLSWLLSLISSVIKSWFHNLNGLELKLARSHRFVKNELFCKILKFLQSLWLRGLMRLWARMWFRWPGFESQAYRVLIKPIQSYFKYEQSHGEMQNYKDWGITIC